MFTADTFGEGGDTIASILKANNIQASFFLTGNFYRNKKFKTLIQTLKTNGHYLGAHSDKHLLYVDWIRRDSLLVTRPRFERDLKRNYRRMKKFGIDKEEARYFMPPYEWYNSAIVDWTSGLALTLVNFSPGTLSAADYTYPEMNTRYRSSATIFDSIIEYERKNASGLNGFILLLHAGTDPRRTDKFYYRLDKLIDYLNDKGYEFRRVDDLLN